ncbi:MAG: Hydrogenase maturation protease [Dehalococcoidales bacterium]|nr:Hydrogenase maturation protease [Dehalococcoidales bacterium]
MKTLVLGLGNTILSDDGVGIRIAEELKDRLEQQEATVMETSMAGLDILELLTGYDRVIIIDAIQTRGGEAGQIYRLEPEAFDTTCHAASPHDVNFATALELGRRLGLALPRQITIFAVEAADVTTFSERCTPEVEQTIPSVVALVMQELNGGQCVSKPAV